MRVVKYDVVNPLINPVSMDDIVIAQSGEKYKVNQNMCGDYWLTHVLTGQHLTNPVSSQIGICAQIDQLANI